MTNAAENALDLETVVSGRLHCVVAFDWGEEVQLEQAAELVPAELQSLPRRRRTPTTIAYRPSPLRIRLASTSLQLPERGSRSAEVEAMVFDFGAATVAFRVPFSLSMRELTILAAELSRPDWLIKQAILAAEPLFHRLAPAIKDAEWSSLSEEYFTFEITPGPHLPSASELLRKAPQWLASLLRLDEEPLSNEEMAEALRQRLSYRPDDIVLVEWAAAVILDRDCDETLHTIEFANLQLLEYRFIDQHLDDTLSEAQRHIHPAVISWLPFWKTHSRPLRMLSEMRLDSVITFERASSTLQLVGDQYLSRVYRMLSSRFCLREWSENVRAALDVAEGVHEILSSQSAMLRLELLELVVVLLIALEIGLAFAS